MAEDLFEGGVTFIGEEVNLYVEAEEFFAPDVTVTFTGTHPGASGPVTLTFIEKLTARPSTLRDPANAKGKKATRILWKVNVNKNPNFKDTTVILKYTVSGKADTGSNMAAVVQERIVIGGIKITTDPKLTRIMVHEFAKPDGNTFVFDPAPLEAYLNTLTPEQKRTLFKHAISKPAGRLVVFITIYPKKENLRMNADYCEAHGAPRPPVRPNATFSVFHCFDPAKGGVVFVCHTEHFLLNLRNSLGTVKKDGTKKADPRDTWIWVHSKQDGKTPNEWLKKSNPRPIQHKIATEFPQGRNDGVLWSRVFTPKGQDIMMGNTMHGMINTVGCWMLFRNYNWPRPIHLQLDLIYRKLLRGSTAKNKEALIKDALATVGYDVRVKPDSDTSNSMGKFSFFDQNFAYLWFFHEVVGVKYFSDRTTFFFRDVNEIAGVETHRKDFRKTFPIKQAGTAPTFGLPEEGTFAYHDPVHRRRTDKGFKPDNSLWRDNAMGFRASQGFIPQGKERSDLSAAEIESVSWADVYFYREDGVDVNKLTTLNYSEKDPNV